MYSSESLEGMLYKSVDNSDIFYPEIEKEDFNDMILESTADRGYVMCFPFYMKMEGRTYITIYIWDTGLTNGYKKFVLEQGYALAKEDEELFLEYLGSNILVEETRFHHLVRKVKAGYPEIHLECYQDWTHTLLHLYCTFHRTGPYEILFKANLNYLAVGLGSINEYNFIGSSPEKIFDVPIGMLRALNSDFGVKIMQSVENRELANCLYARYHNIIHGTRMNEYQWRYMKEQEEDNYVVDKQMYVFLGKISGDKQYFKYLKYAKQKENIADYYPDLPKYPNEEKLDELSQMCDWIEWGIENECGIDCCLKDIRRRYKDIYEYETSDYIVLMPESYREILEEARKQHNCLYRYVIKLICNYTIILFLREKGKEDTSLVTFEVNNGVIRQAFQAYNRMLDPKQKKFLEKYAFLKNLELLSEDRFDWDDGDEFWENQLL